MSETAMQQMYGAVTNGDVDQVRRLLKDNPSLLYEMPIDQTWLHHAASEKGNLPVVRVLVEAGIDVNSRTVNRIDGALANAVAKGNLEIATWLLEQGANPNQGRVLIRGVNSGSLEMVKLLINQGADLNICYVDRDDDDEYSMTPLSHAVGRGFTEIADYLRSQGAVEPGMSSGAESSDLQSEILQHVKQYLGQTNELSFSEIVSGDVPVTVHVVPPSDPDAPVTLVTSGMSSRAMMVPKGSEEYQYAELLIYLPPGWPLSLDALQYPKNSWPIDWLRRIADYPHSNNTWLGGSHAVISNGEPPEPLCPGVNFSALLLLCEESEFGQLVSGDGRLINFYTLFPLYSEERNIEKISGTASLLELFQHYGVSNVVDVNRPNVGLAETA